MVRSVLSLIVVAAVAVPAAAEAAEPRRARDACLPDARAFCSSVQPGGGRLILCLDDHRAKLSPACNAVLPSSAVIRARLGTPAG
jgi:hypothetical protein